MVPTSWANSACRNARHGPGLRRKADPRVRTLGRATHVNTEQVGDGRRIAPARSEEHTSELQSLMRISYAVFCLKKKNKIVNTQKPRTTTQAIPHSRYLQTAS